MGIAVLYIERFLDLELPAGKSCFLWGARQTGKTTYLKKIFPDAKIIDLLQADVFQRYLLNPHFLREELTVESKETLIIIDEVQKVPALLDEVHGLIEAGYQFILCGSSARRLKSTGANLLGGRAWRYHFLPLCYPELKELNWGKIFNNGLIPNHYLSKAPNKEFAAYLYDYVLSEVQYEAQLRKRESFARFMDILGTCQGEMISYTNIARDCGVDKKTVRSYFEILEDMYLGYFLYPYKNKGKRQTIQEQPKFYLFDTGVASYLKQLTWTAMRGTDAGQAFEHYIFLELMAYKLLNDKRDDITYWRTKEGLEVDFLVQELAFEVKMTDKVQQRHLKGLQAFGEEHDFVLNVISLETTKRVMSIDNQKVIIWPVEEFLKELWANKMWI